MVGEQGNKTEAIKNLTKSEKLRRRADTSVETFHQKVSVSYHLMRHPSLLFCLLMLSHPVYAQNIVPNPLLRRGNEKASGFDSDSTETTNVPEGIYVWKIDLLDLAIFIRLLTTPFLTDFKTKISLLALPDATTIRATSEHHAHQPFVQ